MGDAYWRYAQARQSAAAAAVPPPALLGKRARPDFDVPGGHDLTGYYGRDDGRGAPRGMREGDSLGASYERYLRSGQHGSLPIDDPRIMGLRGADLPVAKRQSLGAGGGRPETPLPPDASKTLFVEGLPANCSRREVAHIFRPFVGYREVRLVTKDSRHSKGDALVLCFVDFLSPAHAATAMDALQDSRCQWSLHLSTWACFAALCSHSHLYSSAPPGFEDSFQGMTLRQLDAAHIVHPLGSVEGNLFGTISR